MYVLHLWYLFEPRTRYPPAFATSLYFVKLKHSPENKFALKELKKKNNFL